MEAGGPRPALLAPPVSEAAIVEAIRRLPPGELRPGDYQVPAFEIFADWDIACHYAPLDHVEPAARVVLVGISPSAAQAAAAFAAARDALWAGASWGVAQRLAKRSAAFAGPLLTNLVRMLDAIGLPERLAQAGVARVAGSRELFAGTGGELQVTHCVRYPLLVNGRDYTGRRPALMRTAWLRESGLGMLGVELRAMPEALVLPLGRIAAEAVGALVDAHVLAGDRCLVGLPHPSGANGHREVDFERVRAGLEAGLARWFAPGGPRERSGQAPEGRSLQSR